MIGVEVDERMAAYYIGLLDDVHCHADAHEQARWFGDDVAFKASVYDADLESFAYLRIVLRTLNHVAARRAMPADLRRALAQVEKQAA